MNSSCSCSRSSTERAQSPIPVLRSFERIWPPGLSFPPFYPWMGSILDRRTALSLLPSPYNAGTTSFHPIPNSDELDIPGTDTSCPDCPITSQCNRQFSLPSLAEEWYRAGGVPRSIVVILYDLLGEQFCKSNECENLFPELEDCQYICISFKEGESDGEFIIVCEYRCCCNVRLEPGPLPKGPQFPGPKQDKTQ